MNQKQAKRMRRSMRQYFRKAGMSPEALQARVDEQVRAMRPQVRPKPRWMPARLWSALVRRVVS